MLIDVTRSEACRNGEDRNGANLSADVSTCGLSSSDPLLFLGVNILPEDDRGLPLSLSIVLDLLSCCTTRRIPIRLRVSNLGVVTTILRFQTASLNVNN